MRKSIVLMIGVWSLIGLVIIGILIAGVSYYGVSRASASSESFVGDASVDETLPMDGIDNIRLDISAGNVTVRHSNDGSFRAVQDLKNMDESFLIKVEKNGSTIDVGPKKRINFGFFNLFNLGRISGSENTIVIYIPKNYAGNLKVNLSAGNLDITDSFSADELDIKVSAGKLTGDAGLSARSSVLHVSAGDLILSGLSSGYFDISTSAGKLKVGSLSGSGKVSVSAGSVIVDSLELTGPLKAHTSAGNIKIGLAGEPSLDYKLSASAGSINTYFAGNISGSGSKASGKIGEGGYMELDISTSAGSIDITKAF